MSKEVIRSSQFRAINKHALDMEFEQTQEHKDELAQLYQGLFETYQPGKLVTGTIIKVDSDGVLVDINFKSYGLIPSFEFTDFELKKLTPGSQIEVLLEQLESSEGTLRLSYEKAKAMRVWDEITKLFEENKPVEGVVTHKVKGGLSVDVGIPAFLPGSQVDVHRVNDFDQFVGQTITANIIKINKKRGNIIISRRKYISEQRSEDRKKVLEGLVAGQVIQGVVKNITNYGAFIDIGGVDGLLHITDMTWGRIAHPSELIKIGDAITVKVLSFDKENEKISLGIKQLSENPWEALSDDVKVGSRIKGIITSITDYGLFVEVAPGVEGLVHISEVSWTERINDLNKYYKVGQEVEVLVASLDKVNRRMSLSVKQLEKNPWVQVAEQFKVGDKIKGKISNITDFGIFVELLSGIDGLVHISDFSWTEHIAHPSDIYKRGQEVEAVVLAIDENNKRISLGIKQLLEDPWNSIEAQYPVNSLVDGEVSKITNFGAFVRLPSGIEGLVHKSEFGDKAITDVLAVGQKVQLRVVKVSKEEHKLGLSLKLSATEKEQRPAREQKPRVEKRAEKPAAQERARAESTAPKTKSMFQLELEKLQQQTAEAHDGKGE